MDPHRRKDARFFVELAITLKSESQFWVASANNVSQGGVFVATKELKPIGSRVELEVTLPGGFGVVRTVGVVRWIRETSSSADAPLGMGIQFDEIGADALKTIGTFLAARPPLNVSAPKKKRAS